LALVVLLGCSAGTSDSSVSTDAGNHEEQPPIADGSARPPDAEPNETAPSLDRCFVAACDPAVLPEQAQLPFLEDVGDGWQRLIQADWQLGAQTEGYRCAYKTVPQDVYIVAFSPLTPPGTHHTFGLRP
jgi:hypothetical protein